MYSDAFFVSITILEDIGLLVHALETWGILSIASLRGIFPCSPVHRFSRQLRHRASLQSRFQTVWYVG
jgi:hypothetical protein